MKKLCICQHKRLTGQKMSGYKLLIRVAKHEEVVFVEFIEGDHFFIFQLEKANIYCGTGIQSLSMYQLYLFEVVQGNWWSVFLCIIFSHRIVEGDISKHSYIPVIFVDQPQKTFLTWDHPQMFPALQWHCKLLSSSHTWNIILWFLAMKQEIWIWEPYISLSPTK